MYLLNYGVFDLIDFWLKKELPCKWTAHSGQKYTESDRDGEHFKEV